ncbi:MAG TPA: ABC transporter permease [Vicinamibacterales bacterium]|jgi:putative ABC transport system permease protein
MVLSRLSAFLRNLLHRRRVDDDLDEELRAYVDLAAADNEREGLTGEHARRAALLELQGLEQVKERVRDVRAGARIEQFWQDLSYGARMLAKRRGFTAAALATLALGIGINTAVFTIVDAVILRPPPYRDPSRLVKICGNPAAIATDDVALLDYLALRDGNTVFESMAADDGSDFAFEYAGATRRANVAIVTANWLSTLGVTPMLGRGFTHEESLPGRSDVTLVTYAAWKRLFGSDPGIVGKTIVSDGRPLAIVGILPPNVLRYDADFLRPLVEAEYPADRRHTDLDVFARLRPGVAPAQAQAEIAAIGRRLQLEYPSATSYRFGSDLQRGFSVIPLEKYYASISPSSARGLLLMLGAVTLVLLTACINVANLVLARAVVRYRECVVRVALGATRGRLVRQLLTENLLLFAAGGALGALAARWLVDIVLALAVREGYVPERMAVAVDGRVLLASLATSLAIGTAFGWIVAMRASRIDVNDGLRESSSQSPSGPSRGRLRRALIVAELTASLVLLVGFSLIARSFVRIQANGAGIDVEHLVQTGGEGGRSFPSAVLFWRNALDAARSVPGIQLAAVTSRPPVNDARDQYLRIDGRPSAPADAARAGDIFVSPDYFAAMGIPLLKGRVFTDRDDGSAPPVVVVSQTFARRYFGDEEPLGRRIAITEDDSMLCCSSAGSVVGVWREIVGVVGDIRQGNLDDPLAATMYRPYTQIIEHDMFLIARADPRVQLSSVVADLGARLRATGAPWWDVQTTRDAIGASGSLRQRRFILILLGSFAALAVLLAALGLYGVVAYSVAERKREIGVRIALGAAPRTIVGEVLRESLRLSIVSVGIGVVAAYFLTRLVATLLFGITATDAVSYVGVCVFVVALTLVASYLPARRAGLTDPLRALNEH